MHVGKGYDLRSAMLKTMFLRSIGPTIQIISHFVHLILILLPSEASNKNLLHFGQRQRTNPGVD